MSPTAPDAFSSDPIEPRVLSVHVGKPKKYTWLRRELESSIFKDPVEGPVRVFHHNLEGDDQADRKSHGGADKAVYAYAREDEDWWESQLGRSLTDGLLGQNLTTGSDQHDYRTDVGGGQRPTSGHGASDPVLETWSETWGPGFSPESGNVSPTRSFAAHP